MAGDFLDLETEFLVGLILESVNTVVAQAPDAWRRSLELFVAAGAYALCGRKGGRSRDAYSLRISGFGHAYHCVRHSVRLLLEAVAWLIHGEFRLNHTIAKKPLHRLISHLRIARSSVHRRGVPGRCRLYSVHLVGHD